MSETLTLTIELSTEAREFLRERVERGEYPSEGELVSQSVESMMNDAEQTEQWFQEPNADDLKTWMLDAVATYDRMKVNPERGIPATEVQRHLEERRLLRKMSA